MIAQQRAIGGGGDAIDAMSIGGSSERHRAPAGNLLPDHHRSVVNGLDLDQAVDVHGLATGCRVRRDVYRQRWVQGLIGHDTRRAGAGAAMRREVTRRGPMVGGG